MWQIGINGQGVDVTAAVRRLVERDVRAELEACSGRVAFAHVRLWEPIEGQGPRTCYIRVDLRPSGGVALGATAPKLADAVRRASERVGRAVRSQLERNREPGRGSYSWFRT